MPLIYKEKSSKKNRFSVCNTWITWTFPILRLPPKERFLKSEWWVCQLWNWLIMVALGFLKMKSPKKANRWFRTYKCGSKQAISLWFFGEYVEQNQEFPYFWLAKYCRKRIEVEKKIMSNHFILRDKRSILITDILYPKISKQILYFRV